MTIVGNHTFVSSEPEDANPALVRTSNWNADHQITMTGPALAGRAISGVGQAQEITLGTNLSFAGNVLNAAVGADLTGASIFLPPSDDYAGIMAARAAAIAAGGGVVRLKPIRYPSFGNQTIPVVSGVSYLGDMPVIISPNSGAPDIGALLDAGTILEADGNTSVFSGRTEPGLEFTGSISNAVLTVATTVVSDQTGIVGFLDAGSNIRQDGVIGAQIFIVAQLTSTEPGGALGRRGTYSVMTTAAQNITNPPPITEGNTWRCEYISGVTIRDIGFINARNAVRLGAYGTQGCSWSHFQNLHSYNTTEEPYDILNFEHITVEGLYSFSCAHGPRICMWAARGNGNLGNSLLNKIYNYASNGRFERPMTFGTVLGGPVVANPGGASGTMYHTHVQNNQFNRTALDVVFTLTSGSSDIAVPPAQMSQFLIDMPVRFASSLGGFTGGAVNGGSRPAYFIVSVNTANNTLRLSLTPRDPPITATASGPISSRSYGFASIMFAGTQQFGTKAEIRGLDVEGAGTMSLIYAVANGYIRQPLFTDSGEESIVIRRSSGITLEAANGVGIDAQGNNSNLYAFSPGRVFPVSQPSGGNTLVGIYQDGSNGNAPALNLSANRNQGQPTLRNSEPGNGAVTVMGNPLRMPAGQSNSATASISNGSSTRCNGVYSGTVPAVWTWTPANIDAFAGMEQTFKNGSNTAGATLTITLGASSGTFDGLTGGSSLGKSIILQPGDGATFGGSLVMVCFPNAAGSHNWGVKALTNGAML
jgi:hypothetical protein